MKMRWSALRAAATLAWLFSFATAQTEDTPTCNLQENPYIVADQTSWSKIAQCPKIIGNVKVVWQDNTLPTSLSLNDLESLNGSLTFMDTRTDKDVPGISIRADKLGLIEGTLNFTGMPRLEELFFRDLYSVWDLIFDDVTLTESSTIDAFNFPILDQVRSMTFTGTTLTDIGKSWSDPFRVPLTFPADEPGSFSATGNANLQAIRIPGYVSDQIDVTIQGNNEAVTAEFDDITNCTLNLQGVSNFTASSLVQVGLDSDIAVNGSVSGTELKLATRQDSLVASTSMSSITNNGMLELSLPSLTTIIGPFQLSDNSNLKTISFGRLQSIFGQVELSGAALDSIKLASSPVEFEADGALVIQTDDQAICSNLQQDNPQIKCEPVPKEVDSGPAPVEGGGDSDSDEDSDKKSGGLSTGAKAGIGVAVGLGVPLLLLLAFFLYRHHSRRARARVSPRGLDQDVYVKDVSPNEATTSPGRYNKVRSETLTEEIGDGRDGGVRPVSSFSYGTNQRLVSPDRERDRSHDLTAAELEEQQGERFEMEEQQGPRHEMDARSLPDLDMNYDDDVDRRSLDDIERSRNSGFTWGAGGPFGHVPPGSAS